MRRSLIMTIALLAGTIAAGAVVAVALPAAAQSGAGYVVDQHSKCALWVYYSRTSAVRWEGSCKNGKADGPGRYRIEFATGGLAIKKVRTVCRA